MKCRYLVVLLIICIFLITINTGLAARKAEDIINWNKPVSMVERLTADKYILPEGWREATKGVKELVFYNSGGLAGDIATAMNIELFQQKTGIKVTAIGLSTDSEVKTLSHLVSRDGSVPLLLANNPWKEMSSFSATKKLVSLDCLYPPEVQKLYNPAVKTLLYRDGHWYGSLEVSFNEGLIYYRPSWLKKAGVEVPKTYTELFTAAEKVRAWAKKNVGQDAYGLVFGATPLEAPILFQLLVTSQGGKIYSNGKYHFTDEKAKNAFEYMVNSIKKDIASKEVFNYIITDMGLAFGSGKAGFALAIMNSYTQTFASQFPEIQGDWAVLPPLKWDSKTPDKYRGALLCGNAGLINPYSDVNQQAAAMLLLDFLRSKEAQANEIVVEGNETFISSYYQEDLVKLIDWNFADSVAKNLGIANPKRQTEIPFKDMRAETVKYGTNEAFSPGFIAIEKEFANQLHKAATGSVTLEKALQDLQKFSAKVDN